MACLGDWFGTSSSSVLKSQCGYEEAWVVATRVLGHMMFRSDVSLNGLVFRSRALRLRRCSKC